jgi:hypothetical protein
MFSALHSLDRDAWEGQGMEEKSPHNEIHVTSQDPDVSYKSRPIQSDLGMSPSTRHWYKILVTQRREEKRRYDALHTPATVR